MLGAAWDAYGIDANDRTAKPNTAAFNIRSTEFMRMTLFLCLREPKL
jgi:hypothetical protein